MYELWSEHPALLFVLFFFVMPCPQIRSGLEVLHYRYEGFLVPRWMILVRVRSNGEARFQERKKKKTGLFRSHSLVQYICITLSQRATVQDTHRHTWMWPKFVQKYAQSMIDMVCAVLVYKSSQIWQIVQRPPRQATSGNMNDRLLLAARISHGRQAVWAVR